MRSRNDPRTGRAPEPSLNEAEWGLRGVVGLSGSGYSGAHSWRQLRRGDEKR